MSDETPLREHVYQFVPGPGYPGRLARAVWLGGASARVMLVLLACIALAFILPNVVGLQLILVLLLVAAAVEAVRFATMLRVARRGVPATMTVMFDPFGMRYLAPDESASFAYHRVTDVRRRGGFVFMFRDGSSATVLPDELCPPEAAERVADGMASLASFEADVEAFPNRATYGRSIVSAAVRRELISLFTTTAGVGGAAILVTGMSAAAIMGSVFVAVITVAATAIWLAFHLLDAVSASRRWVGRPVAAGFEDDFFTIAASGTTRRRYSLFDAFEVRGSIAAIRSASSGEWQLYPLALFPEDVRARFAGVSS